MVFATVYAVPPASTPSPDASTRARTADGLWLSDADATAKALAHGLVNEVFDTQEAMVMAALQCAAEIAAKPPVAIWGTKQVIHYARDHSVADSLNYIATWQTGMFQPADMMESFTAKAEKRDPVFPDLLPEPKGL